LFTARERLREKRDRPGATCKARRFTAFQRRPRLQRWQGVGGDQLHGQRGEYPAEPDLPRIAHRFEIRSRQDRFDPLEQCGLDLWPIEPAALDHDLTARLDPPRQQQSGPAPKRLANSEDGRFGRRRARRVEIVVDECLLGGSLQCLVAVLQFVAASLLDALVARQQVGICPRSRRLLKRFIEFAVRRLDPLGIQLLPDIGKIEGVLEHLVLRDEQTGVERLDVLCQPLGFKVLARQTADQIFVTHRLGQILQPVMAPATGLLRWVITLGDPDCLRFGALRRTPLAVRPDFEVQMHVRRRLDRTRSRCLRLGLARIGRGRQGAVKRRRAGDFNGQQPSQLGVHLPQRAANRFFQVGMLLSQRFGAVQLDRLVGQPNHARQHHRQAQGEQRPDLPRAFHRNPSAVCQANM
jgi:hypothetical protein